MPNKYNRKRSSVPIEGLEHGTLKAYVHGQCGCDACRACMAAYKQLRNSLRPKEKVEADRPAPDPPFVKGRYYEWDRTTADDYGKR